MSRKSLAHWFLPHESNNQRARLIHPSATLVLCLLVIGIQAAISLVSRAFPQILGYASQIPPAEIVRLTNIQRQDRGLPSLRLDSQLSAAAATKAQDMLANNYWAHVSPSGTQPWSFIVNSGYAYRYAGENLARDFSDPNSIVSAWIDSPSHKDNLLSNRYQDIGVAVVDGQLDGRDTTLVVQLFGTRLSAPPQLAPASGITVAAQEEPEPTIAVETAPTAPIVTATVKSAITPFGLSKTLFLILLGVLVAVLVADLILTHYRSVVRWTSKSLAHLMYLLVLTAAVSVAIGGKIL